MERMRGEVGTGAASGNQELYLPECDGIAALRRSLIGALGENSQQCKGRVTSTNA
jgi:hypothetical protein